MLDLLIEHEIFSERSVFWTRIKIIWTRNHSWKGFVNIVSRNGPQMLKNVSWDEGIDSSDGFKFTAKLKHYYFINIVWTWLILNPSLDVREHEITYSHSDYRTHRKPCVTRVMCLLRGRVRSFEEKGWM